MNPRDPNVHLVEMEAFSSRGLGDLMSSHDFEDIINVIDGRPGIEGKSLVQAASLRIIWVPASRRLHALPILKTRCRVWWCMTSYMKKGFAACAIE
ncbi:MAG: hypothetical protein ABIG70_04410 [Pseudomonadota bacterium]